MTRMSSTASLRRRPVHAADIRTLGGSVSIVADHDRIDRTPFFRLSYVSRGGDLVWASQPIADEDGANAAAEALAAFVNGRVVRS